VDERNGTVSVSATALSSDIEIGGSLYAAPSARVMTDESAIYNGVGNEFAAHQSVNLKAGQYVNGDAHVNTSESVHSLMNRGVVGVYHHWSVKHLHRYCCEFDFRFNRRKIRVGERPIEAIKSVEGKRLYYKDPLRKLNAETALGDERVE
jgi:hypothetical protein